MLFFSRALFVLGFFFLFLIHKLKSAFDVDVTENALLTLQICKNVFF